jgi:hypothetical protein
MLPFWTSVSTFSTATRTGPFLRPWYCGCRFCAVLAKIWPVGAPLKNAFGLAIASSLYSAGCEGRLPV